MASSIPTNHPTNVTLSIEERYALARQKAAREATPISMPPGGGYEVHGWNPITPHQPTGHPTKEVTDNTP